jgi:hypothetical protein
VDPTSAENHTTSPENIDETGGDHQRSSTDDSEPGDADDDHQCSSENDAEPDGADDVSPKTTKHSPVTRAERDNHAKDEARKEKQKGKERDKEKEALRSPVRRS